MQHSFATLRLPRVQRFRQPRSRSPGACYGSDEYSFVLYVVINTCVTPKTTRSLCRWILFRHGEQNRIGQIRSSELRVHLAANVERLVRRSRASVERAVRRSRFRVGKDRAANKKKNRSTRLVWRWIFSSSVFAAWNNQLYLCHTAKLLREDEEKIRFKKKKQKRREKGNRGLIFRVGNMRWNETGPSPEWTMKVLCFFL